MQIYFLNYFSSLDVLFNCDIMLLPDFYSKWRIKDNLELKFLSMNFPIQTSLQRC